MKNTAKLGQLKALKAEENNDKIQINELSLGKFFIKENRLSYIESVDIEDGGLRITEFYLDGKFGFSEVYVDESWYSNEEQLKKEGFKEVTAKKFFDEMRKRVESAIKISENKMIKVVV